MPLAPCLARMSSGLSGRKRITRAGTSRVPGTHSHGGNGVVGDVDLSRFDPTKFLRDFYRGEEIREGGRTVREFELTAEETEIEVAPGIVYPAWAYNGQVPGPTLRATEGERLRIRFKNNSPHPHTIHFHGFHPANMDGVFELVGYGAGVRVRVRRRAGRAASLPLPHVAAQEAHRKRPLRGLHHRPRRRPSRGRRDGHGHERLRHQLRRLQRSLRRQHRCLPLPAPSRTDTEGAFDPGVRGQRAGVRLHKQLPHARQLLPLLSDGHEEPQEAGRSNPPSSRTRRSSARGSAGSWSSATVSPASSCSTPMSASSPSSAGWACSR